MLERRRLPDDRAGATLKFKILEYVEEGVSREVKGHIQTGEYADGSLGEVFIRLGKPGASEAMYDDYATVISVGLQYGVPLRTLLEKARHRKYAPAGRVLCVDGIKECSSLLDLVAQWLLLKYDEKAEV